MNKKTVLAVIEKYAMLEKGDTVVVGFSGGADSVSLLYVLLQLKNDFALKLTAAHVNHGIRGKEAERDENFCKCFCEKHGIEFKLLKADVPEGARANAMSEEEYGRKIRYEFFRSLAGENGKIATAHNLNDCAETLLFNLTRGTSSKGACSIPAVRGNIIRPLIETPREEIEKFCNENALDFVSDSTNFENEYSRNKIRNIVLPALKEINPSVVTALSRYIEGVKQDEEILSSLASECYEKCLTDGKLCQAELSKLQVGILKRVILKFLSENTNADISSKHIEDIISIIGKNNKSVNTAGGLTVVSRNGFLMLDRNALEKPESFEILFEKKNTVIQYPYGTLKIEIIKDLQILNKEDMENCVDCDKISNTLCLRGRHSGDNFTLRKRNVTKSLKKLFNEDNIEPQLRERLAVVSDADKVIWVEGYGASKKFAANKNSKNILKIKIDKTGG